jgi:hypothetical protein
MQNGVGPENTNKIINQIKSNQIKSNQINNQELFTKERLTIMY